MPIKASTFQEVLNLLFKEQIVLLTIKPKKYNELIELCRKSGEKDLPGLHNQALGLFYWVMEEIYNGRKIFSFDPETGQYKELLMDFMGPKEG